MDKQSVFDAEFAKGRSAGLGAAEAGFRAEREELRAQRDELIKALEAINKRLAECRSEGIEPNKRDMLDFQRWASFALAKARGQ